MTTTPICTMLRKPRPYRPYAYGCGGHVDVKCKYRKKPEAPKGEEK